MKRFILIPVILLLSLISLFIGTASLTFGEILSGDTEALMILFASRFPRLLAVLLAGAAMSVGGLLMQQLARNKFVSPQTGATISSAQLGVVVAMIFFHDGGKVVEIIFAFVFALAGTFVFMMMVQRTRFKNILFVPLIGMIFGGVIASGTEFLAYRYNIVQNISDWLLGNFSLILRGNYEILYFCLPLIIVAFLFANHFNIVGMGDDFAKNLGINYNLVLYSGLGIVSLLTAGVVVTAGSVPFVGLIVPNMVSLLKGDKMKMTLIDTALFGSLFVLACDIAGRLIIYPYEVPIGLTVGIVGSGLFIFMIWKKELKIAR